MTQPFTQKRLTYTPPDKGSFPIDHEGVCKELMIKYMDCIYEYQGKRPNCRQQIKEYLSCRMDNSLMNKEEWSKLGLAETDNSNKKVINKN